MIFVKFDKYGALDFIDLQNETIYKGSNRVNRLFVTFDGIDYKTSHYLTFSALVNEKDYGGNLTDLASAKSTYIYHDVTYHGYTFWLFSNLTAQSGTLKLSVRLVDRDTDRVLVSGILPLIVQDTAISTYATVNITTTQYQALLTAFDELSQKIDESNFKTINEESVMGSGDIQLPTFNYVDSRFNNLEDKNAELNKIIARQDKRIKQLELASEGNILYTSTESDLLYYTYDVSLDTLPFVEIDKIGGMTYKSENLLVFDDVAETTTNGITYKVKDGTFILNGTATANAFIMYDVNINGGNYTINAFNNQTNANVLLQVYNTNGFLGAPALNTLNKYEALSSTGSNITSFRIRIASGTTLTNFVIKPMLASGTTAPSEFKQGFNGLRNSAVTRIICSSLNSNNVINVGDTIRYIKSPNLSYATSNVSLFQAKGKTTDGVYTVVLNGSNKRIGIFKRYDFNYNDTYLLITSENTTYDLIETFEEELIITSITNSEATNNTLLNAYKVVSLTPIPTAIQSLDGYGLGVNDTYNNYVDFENKKFVKGISSYTFTGNEGFGQANTNTSGVYRYFCDVLKNIAVGVNASNVKGALLMADLNTATADETYLCKDGVCIDSNGRLYFFKTDIQSASDMANYLKGKTIYYGLLNPTETDISDLIDDDLIVEVESGGQITFDNEYKQDVLFTWTYQEKM